MDNFTYNSLSGNIGHNTQANNVEVLENLIQDKEIVINRNKPWRVVIRRIISDGREYEGTAQDLPLCRSNQRNDGTDRNAYGLGTESAK